MARSIVLLHGADSFALLPGAGRFRNLANGYDVVELSRTPAAATIYICSERQLENTHEYRAVITLDMKLATR
eukprot:scaffold124948_cov28-Prasinocladus_malaysianus.AAC.1